MAANSPTKTLGGGASTRLRHSRTVSQKWLERCKPDLTEFEAAAEEVSDGKGGNMPGEDEEEIEEEDDEDDEEIDEFSEAIHLLI